MSTKSVDFAKSSSLPAGAPRSLGGNLVTLTRFFLTCLEVAEQRRQLATLDERALTDIGLSPDDVQKEVGRGFWDISGVPHTGRR